MSVLHGEVGHSEQRGEVSSVGSEKDALSQGASSAPEVRCLPQTEAQGSCNSSREARGQVVL